MDWYYALDNHPHGPVSETELARLADQGTVGAGTYVWHAGLPAWLALGAVVARPAGLPLHRCAGCGQVLSPARLVPLLDHWCCARCKPWQMQRLMEFGREEVSVYASFWWRVLAFMIDNFILTVVNQVLSLVFQAAAGAVAISGRGAEVALLIATLLSVLSALGIAAAYHIFFVGKYGATPGKMVCRLRVVRADGSPVGYGLATGRHFAEYLSMFSCYIGYIIAAFDLERRTIHDWVCGTRVIRR